MVLCCPRQVNWLRSSVVNVGFAEIMNGALDGVSLDALHAIWIWRAQLERVGGAALMGAQETQRVLRRSSLEAKCLILCVVWREL